jgi:hypothetical protein
MCINSYRNGVSECGVDSVGTAELAGTSAANQKWEVYRLLQLDCTAVACGPAVLFSPAEAWQLFGLIAWSVVHCEVERTTVWRGIRWRPYVHSLELSTHKMTVWTCVMNSTGNGQLYHTVKQHAAYVVAFLTAAWPFKAQWLLYVPPCLTFTNSTFCPHSVFMCISEQTAIISLYNINWLVCITETECVYCAVRTEGLNVIEVILDFKVCI